MLGKDLFFCLKKLALFWLPPRSERTIIQRNGRRSNHDTSVARQRIRVKNPVQSSVYRAPLEGIVTFSRRIRVISSPSLSPNLSIISNEVRSQAASQPVFPLSFRSCCDPSWNLELISGLKFNSIRNGVRELFIGAIGSPYPSLQIARRHAS